MSTFSLRTGLSTMLDLGTKILINHQAVIFRADSIQHLGFQQLNKPNVHPIHCSLEQHHNKRNTFYSKFYRDPLFYPYLIFGGNLRIE